MAFPSIANGLLLSATLVKNRILAEAAHKGGFFVLLFVIVALTRKRFMRS